MKTKLLTRQSILLTRFCLPACCAIAGTLVASTLFANVTGTWQTTMGQANLEQSGSQVLGTLLNNGQAYLVKGTALGNQLNLKLSINGNVIHSIENVVLASNGASGTGRYRSLQGSGLSSPFSMTAQAGGAGNGGGNSGGQGGGQGGPTPAYNIAGSWISALGPIKLTQTENKVRGELKFNNGVVAVLNGTIVNSDYNFQWGIDGQILGSGSLHLSQDMKTLQGTYVDNRVGHPVSLKFTRSQQ